MPLTGFEASRNDLVSENYIAFSTESFAAWDYPAEVVSFDTANFDEILDAWLNETPSSWVDVNPMDVEVCNDPARDGASGTVALVPIPGAVWLFGPGLLGLIRISRRKNA